MKVVFVQPGQFLRTSRKTNPFFDPIIDVCQENGIDWKLYLPSVRVETGYPKDHIRDYHRFSFLSKWFWRMAHVLLPWLSVARVHWLHGFFARPFCREWRDADLVITIAQTYSNELVAMRPERRVVDVQHGVIYSSHCGYFGEDASLRLALQRYLNFEFWLYGPGYANCFFKNPENNRWLDGRVKVVGDVLGVARHHEKNEGAIRDAIVVSLQYTKDFGMDVYQSWTNDLTAVFAQMEAVGLQKRYQVLLKHHPRYANSFDISPMMKRFPWLQLTDRSTNDLISHVVYHVTYTSTTAFEYAAEGVPTLFTGSAENRLSKEMMYDEYAYPLPMGFETMKKALDDHVEWVRQGEMVRGWYRKFYAPFDPSKSLALLRGERADVI